MVVDKMPIYLLPGMVRDFPFYSKLLRLLPTAEVVPFIDPEPNESLHSYAQRMSTQFPKPCLIGGVSFGGIVAQEISRVIQPAGCIVIASIQQPSELPLKLRLCRLLGKRFCSWGLNTLGTVANAIPDSIRNSSTASLTVLSCASGQWERWVASSVLSWSPESPLATPLLHIHGDADTIFPLRYTHPDVIVPNGRHDLPRSHPVAVADAIQRFVCTLEPSE